MSDNYFPQCQPAIPISPSLYEIHSAASKVISSFNPFGAALFIAYIFAALALITYIIYTLRSHYRSLPTAIKTKHGFKVRIQLLVYASITSFIFLSWNMIAFLFQSFTCYHIRERTPDIHPYWELVPVFCDWIINSTFFTDFSWSLIKTPLAASITQASLTGTMVGTLFLCALGRHYRIALWPYLLLSQILPVSFSMSLLVIHALLLEPTTNTNLFEALLEPFQGDEFRFWEVMTPIAVTLSYWAWLAYVPCVLNSEQLLVQVATARAFLVATWAVEWDLGGVCLSGVGALGLLMGLSEGGHGLMGLIGGEKGEWMLWGMNQAVRTLGWDVWIMLGVVGTGLAIFASREPSSASKGKGALEKKEA